MGIVWTRMLKSIYRKEPVISFIVTIGAVDAAIGGLSEHWSLMTFGMGMVGVAVGMRLRQMQRQHEVEQTQRAPVHLLPPTSSRPSLPQLNLSKKNPPGRP